MKKQSNSREVENITAAINDGVYVFNLKLLCGGYTYFSTYTHWTGFGESYRDIRKPSLVNIKVLYNMLRDLGHFKNKTFLQKGLIIGDREQYEMWLYRKGWGFVTKEFTQSHMSQWLKPHECLRSPLRIFTDIELVPPSTLKQRARPRMSQQVQERDGKQCLICGSKVQLTMQHVTPYSYGGETTLRNLVTLCDVCNQKCGVQLLTELYDLAGLHHGFDPSLVKNTLTKELICKVISLSDNLMQTRCEVW